MDSEVVKVNTASEWWGKATTIALQERKLIADFKECIKTQNLQRGKQIHAEAVESGHASTIYIATSSINMYAKCGSMVDAREVFDSLKHPDEVSWNVLILGYAENGQGCTALNLFTKMLSDGPAPNSCTFVAALKACTSLAVKEGAEECRDRGLQIKTLAVENCCNSDRVQNTLVDFYGKCGSMKDAQVVFDSMERPDVVSWTALIMGYANNGQSLFALDLFARMKMEGSTPSSVTILAALKACIRLVVTEGASKWECRNRGEEVHKFAVEIGCNSDACVRNALFELYANCGSIVDAREMFDSLNHANVVSWNMMIWGYASSREGDTALNLFTRMRTEGPAPISVTIMAALKACTSLAVNRAERRDRVKLLHNLALEFGCNSDYVQMNLVELYGKCGSMVNACFVFDSIEQPNVVAWSALIMGYANNGKGRFALDTFTRMRKEGPVPDSITFVAALKACAAMAVKEGPTRWLECRDIGRKLHSLAVEGGCSSLVFVQTTLVDMYAKFGCMVDACEVFGSMKQPNVISWTALILGFADNGEGYAALALFTRMRNEGPAPDAVTFATALKACTMVGALEFGRRIHWEIVSGNYLDAVLVTCLVDFYSKCGSLGEAQSVFDLHTEGRNVRTWNALLAGFSYCGDNEAVFELFEQMQDAGFLPDGVTLLCILTCCSHVGLVQRGMDYFYAMPTKYGIVPTIEHYNCMVDILGRGNKLDDAMTLLAHMPCTPNSVTWKTILGSCRKWKNLEIGRIAYEHEKDC